ncbi:sigma factor-like helix-turn-helix DNA-binding protein [uncultured Prevotella sp.]|uniref:RNA polymerase sigma factor n=1 Tax=uncultured Prevotella sp. TaxID=159272 RepID=UPI003451B691
MTGAVVASHRRPGTAYPTTHFHLRYLQEKSYQEVADEVGVSKVTVFNHLSKAMDWIKEQFK